MIRFSLSDAGAQLPISRLNRHVVVTGSTGYGKTCTLTRIAHDAACDGAAVVVPDIKGDIARGDPVDWTMSLARMGPDLIARALDLTDAQAGALERLDSDGERPATLTGLESTLHRLAPRYGWTRATVAAIERGALRLSRAAPGTFRDGTAFDPLAVPRGRVAALDANKISLSPSLYGAACLAMIEESYRRLPEIGDSAVPRIVFIFDEAHLLFREMPPRLLTRVENLIRLVRSRGIAIVFCSQAIEDIPSSIASQLGTRVQHGLRVATREDIATVRAAAESMPGDTTQLLRAIRNLKIGQAVVSVVREDGSQGPSRGVSVPLASLEGLTWTPPAVAADRRPTPSVAPRDAFTRADVEISIGLVCVAAAGLVAMVNFLLRLF